jgi:hypothetical protein
MSNIYHAHLEPLKKTDSCARMDYKLHLLELPHSCTRSSHFAQPKDTPLNLLIFILTIVYNMDSRCYNKSSPSQMHLVFLHALYFYSSNFFCFHHSSTSTPHIINHFKKQLVYSAKSLVQHNSTKPSLVVHPPIFSKIANKKKNSC